MLFALNGPFNRVLGWSNRLFSIDGRGNPFMSMVVNTNIASKEAQRSLLHSGKELQIAMERLSTGSRINSAADDAAGFAIAERMTSQIKGLSKAIENVETAKGFLEVMDGALASSLNLVHRVNELAVQASNGTNSNSDRANIQTEIDSLISEINRINYETEFNGERVFPVDWERSKTIQTGLNDGNSIEIGLKPVSALNFMGFKSGYSLWSDTPALSTPSPSPLTGGSSATEFHINSGSAQAHITISEGESAASIASKVNETAANTGVFARADTWLYISADQPLFHTDVSLKVNGVATREFSFHYQNFEIAVNDIEEQTGVSASSFDGGVVLYNATGANIQIEFNGPGEINASVESGQTETLVAGANDSITVSGAVKFMSSEDFSISNVDSNPSSLFDSNPWTADGAVLSGSNDEIKPYSDEFAVNNYLEDVNVEYASDLTLVVAKAAIHQIIANRSEIGALTNRFEFVISNLLNVSEQTASARSSIADADFGVEAARLAKAQVLQQSGSAMLAQANALPQMVLSLIR